MKQATVTDSIPRIAKQEAKNPCKERPESIEIDIVKVADRSLETNSANLYSRRLAVATTNLIKIICCLQKRK